MWRCIFYAVDGGLMILRMTFISFDDDIDFNSFQIRYISYNFSSSLLLLLYFQRSIFRRPMKRLRHAAHFPSTHRGHDDGTEYPAKPRAHTPLSRRARPRLRGSKKGNERYGARRTKPQKPAVGGSTAMPTAYSLFYARPPPTRGQSPPR